MRWIRLNRASTQTHNMAHVQRIIAVFARCHRAIVCVARCMVIFRRGIFFFFFIHFLQRKDQSEWNRLIWNENYGWSNANTWGFYWREWVFLLLLKRWDGELRWLTRAMNFEERLDKERMTKILNITDFPLFCEHQTSTFFDLADFHQSETRNNKTTNTSNNQVKHPRPGICVVRSTGTWKKEKKTNKSPCINFHCIATVQDAVEWKQ